MTELICALKYEREKCVMNFHPWIMSGSIKREDKSAKPGDVVKVLSYSGQTLGFGFYNPHSQIRIRLLTFGEKPYSDSIIVERINTAIKSRQILMDDANNAYRLVHAEGDGLPGLIIDKYDDIIVIQITSIGMDNRKDLITQTLVDSLNPKTIYERSNVDSRMKEGLKFNTGVLHGEEVPAALEIKENDMRLLVDIPNGQKTGFFLDQQDSRALCYTVAKKIKGLVLNTFSYTGGFTVAAGLAGRETVSVDKSAQALKILEENVKLNGLNPKKHKVIKADVFEYLRREKQKFDMIVLDPPAFAKNKGDIRQASRGYKDIALSAIRLLNPGGILLSFSCSSHISSDLFQKITFAAAKDAGRDLQIIKKCSHPLDHPINIYHPEGEYLKGLACVVGGDVFGNKS